MYRELPLEQFIQVLQTLCMEHRSGILFFVPRGLDAKQDADHWGKFILNQGHIISLGYKGAQQVVWGKAALSQIGHINQVKFFFKDSEVKAVDLDSVQVSDTLTQVVFNFFKISLDSSQSAGARLAAVPQAMPIVVQQPISRKKILIADDSQFVRNIVTKALRETPHEVFEAKDGFEALGQLNNVNPDLLLLDIVMPGSLDGYKVLELMKKNEKFKRIPVIILTSRNGLLDKLKGKMSASDEYLTKPFEASQLLQVIDKYLGCVHAKQLA